MFDEFVSSWRWIGDLMYVVCLFLYVDRRLDVCSMWISVCLCASVKASMTQLGSCSKAVRSLLGYHGLGGTLRYLSDHS